MEQSLRKGAMNMDQVKIGNFIAQCRKEKNMTQKQLAEVLGISDKAISKWETGRGLPEAGCMAPLSEALGISVNELLTGERIPAEEYQERAEETMVALAEMKTEVKNLKEKVGSMDKGVKTGIGFGSVLAMVISYHAYASIGWAIFHGILGWAYVIYYLLKYAGGLGPQ